MRTRTRQQRRQTDTIARPSCRQRKTSRTNGPVPCRCGCAARGRDHSAALSAALTTAAHDGLRGRGRMKEGGEIDDAATATNAEALSSQSHSLCRPLPLPSAPSFLPSIFHPSSSSSVRLLPFRHVLRLVRVQGARDQGRPRLHLAGAAGRRHFRHRQPRPVQGQVGRPLLLPARLHLRVPHRDHRVQRPRCGVPRDRMSVHTNCTHRRSLDLPAVCSAADLCAVVVCAVICVQAR